MEEETCEVCTDTLDATDSSISFCDCNYALCLWCACTSGRCPDGVFEVDLGRRHEAWAHGALH